MSLASCQTDYGYVPQAGLTAQTAATLIGSKNSPLSSLDAGSTVFLADIDGQSAGNGWDQPVLLAPGEHQVEFGEYRGSYIVKAYTGFIAVDLDAKAGQTYTLRATVPVHAHFLDPMQADGWIANADGSLASRKIHFFLSQQSSGGVVPIFIPIK